MDRRIFVKSLLASTASAALYALVPQKTWAQNPQPAPLPVPELVTGTLKDGVREYDLRMQHGVHEFFPGVATPTLGINSDYLAPTLKLRVGEEVRLNVTNKIGEPTTLHWHGLHLPAKADGGPHQVIEPDTTWSPQFKVIQHAATYWYHSHMHRRTGEQVWRGLAGLMILEDDLSDTLVLPKTYGVDDFPVILQDRAFNDDGSLAYVSFMHDVMMGMKGNIATANGKITPHLNVKTKKVRLRILNGSNASFYNLGFSDNRSFHQITSDGSFLERPYKINRLFLGPAERAEIIVEIVANDDVMLISDGKMPSGNTGMMGGMMRRRGQMGGMMGRRGGMMGNNGAAFEFLKIVGETSLKSSQVLPKTLLKLDRLVAGSATNVRRFNLEMKMGPAMMRNRESPFSINGKSMDMNRIDEVIKLGTTEIWEIHNDSPLPHPFHIHDIQFQILDRNGRPPHPGEQGLKDTVVVNGDETVRIIAKFEDYADPASPYMYHCHILEHEDAGMMGQFTVIA